MDFCWDRRATERDYPRCAPPKGDSDFEELPASLKRCPDREPTFFRGIRKKTGRLGPVSGASVEMRLHRSLTPLTQRIVAFVVSRPRMHLAPARVQRSEAGVS